MKRLFRKLRAAFSGDTRSGSSIYEVDDFRIAVNTSSDDYDTCVVYRGDTLVFDGISREALLLKPEPAEHWVPLDGHPPIHEPKPRTRNEMQAVIDEHTTALVEAFLEPVFPSWSPETRDAVRALARLNVKAQFEPYVPDPTFKAEREAQMYDDLGLDNSPSKRLKTQISEATSEVIKLIAELPLGGGVAVQRRIEVGRAIEMAVEMNRLIQMGWPATADAMDELTAEAFGEGYEIHPTTRKVMEIIVGDMGIISAQAFRDLDGLFDDSVPGVVMVETTKAPDFIDAYTSIAPADHGTFLERVHAGEDPVQVAHVLNEMRRPFGSPLLDRSKLTKDPDASRPIPKLPEPVETMTAQEWLDDEREVHGPISIDLSDYVPSPTHMKPPACGMLGHHYPHPYTDEGGLTGGQCEGTEPPFDPGSSHGS